MLNQAGSGVRRGAAREVAIGEGLDVTFQALADPTRRLIVERLSAGPASVSELARPLPMSLPAVIQHLHVLETSGLVSSRKVGRVRTCQVEAAALDGAEQWIHERRRSWERRLDRLGSYLAETSDRPAHTGAPEQPSKPAGASGAREDKARRQAKMRSDKGRR
jgi:DNA-binding transcriptional ArsR family regulator